CTKVVPFGQLDRDLRANDLPSFVWITPDVCRDMHDCSTGQGDRWLSGVVPRLLRTLGPDGALFLTWDEGESSDGCCGGAHGGRIPTIVAGPTARAGERSSTPLTHYSLLRTLDEALG